jgi:hypothetical protein
MSGWAIGLVLAALGISGTVAFLVLGGGGLVGAFVVLRSLPSPGAIWRFLTHPVGVVLTMAALSLGFLAYGNHLGGARERANCEARIQASVEAARLADVTIAEERHKAALDQVKQAEAREATVRGEVHDYAEELAKRAEAACRSGADADRWNDGLSLSDESAVPGGAPVPPRRPGRGSLAVPVPQGPRVR